jgi:TolB-like protein/DNA-binding winged helix-turn-helix (wHTH) protein
MQTPGPRETLRFGDFELDVAAYELRRLGRPVKLGRQPMDLLILLVEGRRQLVSRNEIVDRLWGKDVFVDVDTGVNTAISKIRQVLRDSPDAPAFVETVPGKGYRFIAAVETIVPRADSAPAVPQPEPSPAPNQDVSGNGAEPGRSDGHPPSIPPVSSGSAVPATVETMRASGSRPGIRARLGIGLLIFAVGIGIVAFTRLKSGGMASGVTLAVLPFANLGSDPEREYLAAGLTDETSASLAQIDPAHLSVKGRTLRYKGTTKTAGEIGQELSVDYLVESSIRAEGSRLRVTVTLIRVRDQEHVWSQSYEREPISLLGLQQELSTAIAEQIRLRLSPDRMSGLGRRQTQNEDAYDAYLRGRYQMNRRSSCSIERLPSTRIMRSHGPISHSRTLPAPSTAMPGRRTSAHVREPPP